MHAMQCVGHALDDRIEDCSAANDIYVGRVGRVMPAVPVVGLFDLQRVMRFFHGLACALLIDAM
jgi:hypothetical protein